MTKRRTHPGKVKDDLTAVVAKVRGDRRGPALAAELEALGYVVDLAEGMRAVHFIERHCRGTKAPYYGKLVVLRPWQFVVIFTFFACMDESGHRLFRKLWFEVAKKNGKTAMIAWLLLYCLSYASGYGAEIFAAASAAKQAAKIYKPMASIVSQDPALRRMIRPFSGKYMLHNIKMDATFEVMSADADYNDGVIPAAVGVDEVHRHKNDGLWQVLVQGQGTTVDPMFFAITTAGSGRTGLAWDEHMHAEQVIAGQVEDERLLAFIYSVPEDADWTDPAIWRQANPAMGDFLRADDIESAMAKAKSTPTEEHSVRRLRLNQWVAAETKWIDLVAWEQCGKVRGPEALLERNKDNPFYGGLDISHSRDFTAWTMFFPYAEGDELGGDFIWRYWLPEKALENTRAQMRPTLETWARAGFITLCPGEIIDLTWVRDQILKDAADYRLLELGYDKFHAHGIVSDLMAAGLTLVDVPQYHRVLNAPSKQLERMISQRRCEHAGNPVTRWMMSNAVAEVDRDDRIRPSRLKSVDKIDGVLSALFSIERAMVYEEESEFTFYIPDEVSG